MLEFELVLMFFFLFFVGLFSCWFRRYLAIAPYAPNMALELLYIVLFFPGGEIRKLFKFKVRIRGEPFALAAHALIATHFQDKQTPKSAFDAGPKAFKDETDSNDMRPVDEVSARPSPRPLHAELLPQSTVLWCRRCTCCG